MGKKKQLLQGSQECPTLDKSLVEMIFTHLDKQTLISFSVASKYWFTNKETYHTSKTHGLFKHPDEIDDLLIKAVINGHPLIVKKYLALDANPNLSIRDNEIYLMYKVSNFCKPKTKKCGKLINPSALHLAALSKNPNAVEIIKLLLKAGSKLNAMVRGLFSTLDIRMLNHIFDKPQPDLSGKNDVIVTHRELKQDDDWYECEVELSPIKLAQNKSVKSLLYIARFEQLACNKMGLKSAFDALSQAKDSDACETKKYVLELIQCRGDFQGLSCVLSEDTINTLKEQLNTTMSFNKSKCTIL